MFSRFQRFDRPGHVQVIWKWIVNSVNVGVSKQFLIRTVCPRNTQLRCHSFALFQITRCNSIKLDVFAFLHGGNNFACANIGGTEDSPADFVHDVVPFWNEETTQYFISAKNALFQAEISLYHLGEHFYLLSTVPGSLHYN